ncbi:MAG: hypothetical protein ACRD82_05740, partial [Blastocatellia bacterium]
VLPEAVILITPVRAGIVTCATALLACGSCHAPHSPQNGSPGVACVPQSGQNAIAQIVEKPANHAVRSNPANHVVGLVNHSSLSASVVYRHRAKFASKVCQQSLPAKSA